MAKQVQCIVGEEWSEDLGCCVPKAPATDHVVVDRNGRFRHFTAADTWEVVAPYAIRLAGATEEFFDPVSKKWVSTKAAEPTSPGRGPVVVNAELPRNIL